VQEKTTIPTPPQALLDFIRGHSAFVIAGHKEPDGDCIGSQLALASGLRRLGKDVILVSAGPFNRVEICDTAGNFSQKLDDDKSAGRALIVVDCTNLERCGDAADSLKGLPSILIDHHKTTEKFEWCAAEYVAARSPACCILVLKVLLALGLKPTPAEAETLFFGLCTDTGFFRFLDNTNAEVFEAAAFLTAHGANPKKAFEKMNGGKTFESRKLISLVLSRAQSLFDGRLIYSWEELEDRLKLGEESRDSGMLYQLFQSIAGVETICIIRQENETHCTVGLRSKDKIDVSLIAKELGGGGHKNASGAQVQGKIEDCRERVMALYEKIYGR
jgi:phosphoesterase RecJ-like protein